MAKPQGKCIFCNGHNLTKEHIFPKWMRPILVEDSPLPTNTNIRIGSDYFPALNLVNLKPGVTENQGFLFNKRLRVACRTCNNGWMSLLEDACKPVLIDLIHSSPRTLTEAEQTNLATWASLKAAVFECDDPKNAAITAFERDEIFRKKTPPKNWHVWLSSYAGSAWKLRITHFGFQAAIPMLVIKDRPNSQRTMIGLRSAIIYVLSTTFSQPEKVITRYTPPNMQRIWPVGGDLLWPTANVLNDDEANRLTFKFD